MPPHDFTPTPGLEVDGYRLVRFLGRGGFGEVWLCRSGATVSYHAIKFISGADPELLEKEHHSLNLYRAAAGRLRSPHLVPIEHINRHEAGLYYIMPLADGVTATDPAEPDWQPLSLAALIDARASSPAWFSSKEIIGLILPILDALQTLSDAGLVHRDVKPENILFFGGSPCLGDISLLGEDAAAITRRGTPGYATPSWYRDGLPDMFGAAVTLYTLLTGNAPDKMGRANFRFPPQGEGLLTDSERAEWRRLHAVIGRAAEEKVAERYVDFRTMAAAVAATGAVAPPPLPAPPPALPPSTRSRPSSAPKMAAVFGILIVMAVVIYAVTRPGPVPSSGTPSRQEAPSSDEPSAPSPAARKPKIVDARGTFQSVRERVIKVIPAAISTVTSGGGPQLDLGDYADRSAILKAYQARDYSTCLNLLDARTERQPDLLSNPLCLLLKALLLKHLDRTGDLRSVLADFSQLIATDRVEWPGGSHTMALPFMEALGLHKEAEALVTSAIAAAHADPARTGSQARRQEIDDTVLLYRDRARTRILQGNMAGALADEREALALPPGINAGAGSEHPEEARQLHLNTIVMEWELLEQEFPEYDAYLAANGSPEPQPDHRNLKAVD
jgi:serine/threonine protein kinase